jgi:hypothetical protein
VLFLIIDQLLSSIVILLISTLLALRNMKIHYRNHKILSPAQGVDPDHSFTLYFSQVNFNWYPKWSLRVSLPDQNVV